MARTQEKKKIVCGSCVEVVAYHFSPVSQNDTACEPMYAEEGRQD